MATKGKGPQPQDPTEALRDQLKTVRVAPVEARNLDDATNYGRELRKMGKATDEEIQAARDLVRANMKRDIIGVDVDKMTPEELNDQLREISPKLLAGEVLGKPFNEVTAEDERAVHDAAVAQHIRDEVGDGPFDALQQLVINSRLRNTGGADDVEGEILRKAAGIGDNPFGIDPNARATGTTSSGGTGSAPKGDNRTDDPTGRAGGSDPNGAGDDPFVVPGSTQRNDTERTDEPDEVFGGSDDPHQDVEGGDGDGDVDFEDSDEPIPEGSDGGSGDGDGGGSGNSDTEDEFPASDDEIVVEKDGQETEDDFFEDEDSDDDDDDSDDDDDDSDDDDTDTEGSDGGGAGYVLPPGDSDHNFNATGRDAILGRKGQLGGVEPRDGGDVDPVDDDFGSGVGASGPRFTKGTLLGGDRPIGFDSGGGGGGRMPTTNNDGVTDPTPDGASPGGTGPEDDPLGGGNPVLKEDAGDGGDSDDADDGTPEFSFARSRLQQAIDDDDLDLGPDLPGQLDD